MRSKLICFTHSVLFISLHKGKRPRTYRISLGGPLDEDKREYLRDMAKPGARTAWAGWFPKSFAKLLRSFDIPADAATGLALKIRSIITGGMDEIWRDATQNNTSRQKGWRPTKRSRPPSNRELRWA